MLFNNQANTRFYTKTNLPTIGLLNDILNNHMAIDALTGAITVTKEHNANLICFPGGSLQDLDKNHQRVQNILYNFINESNIDALVIMSGILGPFIGMNAFHKFCLGLNCRHLVSIGWDLPGIPSVVIDNENGVYKSVIHLIKDHGYQRIAYIRGPQGSPPANLRYQGYIRALNECGLPVDENLVINGTFREDSGVQAVVELLEQRQADFEALVTGNDDMAIGAIQALNQYGLHVPEDVAVVGFDSRHRGRSIDPPLTSVEHNVTEMVQQGTRMALNLIENEKVELLVKHPAQLAIYGSCGCILPYIAHISNPLPKSRRVANGEMNLPFGSATFRKKFQAEIIQIIKNYTNSGRFVSITKLDYLVYSEWIKLLVDDFMTQLADGNKEAFFSTLTSLVTRSLLLGIDGFAWQDVLSAIRESIFPLLSFEKQITVNSMLNRGRILVNHTVNQSLRRQQLRTLDESREFRHFSQGLGTAHSLAKLMDLIAEDISIFNISSCFIVLYEDASCPTDWATLVLAYHRNVQLYLPAEGKRFSASQLIPDDFLPVEWRNNLIIQALNISDQQIGYAIFEASGDQAELCDLLRLQFSVAIHNALITKKNEYQSQQLQIVTDISQTISVIFDYHELLQQLVDLIKNRFQMYHTQLFFIDENPKRLCLAAGAGTIGKQMVQEKYQILLTDRESLLVRVVNNGTGEFNNKLEDRYVHRLQPELPYAKSVLAVPLFKTNQIIGVLEIQANKSNRFSQEDIHIFSTLASHVSVAIRNSHLYSNLEEQKDQLLQAKAHLEKSNGELEKLSIVARETDNGVLIMDSQGNFEWINKGFTRMFGLTLSELHQQRTDENHQTRNIQLLEEKLESCSGTKETVLFEFTENTITDKDQWFQASLTPILNDKKEIIKILAIYTDITDLKNAQEKALDHAHKVGIAELAIDNLHNMGNSINSLKVTRDVLAKVVDESQVEKLYQANSMLNEHLDHLAEFIQTDQKGKKLMEYYLALEKILSEEHEQMKNMVERLIEKLDILKRALTTQKKFADNIQIVTEEIQVTQLVEDALAKELAALKSQGINVKKHFKPLPPLISQRKKITRILVTLIKVARNSMLTTRENQRCLFIGLEPQETRIKITMRDTGCGISEKEIAHVFTQEYNTYHSEKGFDLHNIANTINELGGKITIHSPGLNQGTTVTLIFPQKWTNNKNTGIEISHSLNSE